MITGLQPGYEVCPNHGCDKAYRRYKKDGAETHNWVRHAAKCEYAGKEEDAATTSTTQPQPNGAVCSASIAQKAKQPPGWTQKAFLALPSATRIALKTVVLTRERHEAVGGLVLPVDVWQHMLRFIAPADLGLGNGSDGAVLGGAGSCGVVEGFNGGKTKLHLAAANHAASASEVKRIMATTPADTTLRDGTGRLPLHYAAIGPNASALLELFKSDPAYSAMCAETDWYGKTPLHYIAENPSLLKAGIVAELVASAATVTGAAHKKVLHEAGVEIVRLSGQEAVLERAVLEATETSARLAADNARLRRMLSAISAEVVA